MTDETELLDALASVRAMQMFVEAALESLSNGPEFDIANSNKDRRAARDRVEDGLREMRSALDELDDALLRDDEGTEA